jgi:hypothetical protein
MIRVLLAAVPLVICAGCVTEGTYPSLQPRAVEKQGFGEPAAPVSAPIAADPVLDRQIGELDARLRAIASGFAGAAGEAERRATAAKGRPAGSEPWLEAQTALAALDDWRAQASSLATDVEELAIARAARLEPPYPALTALGDRTEAEAERQAETIARIQASVAPA